MAGLTCAEARDLASDLLDGEVAADLARQVEEPVARCPTCPRLYRALVAVHRELTKLQQASEAAE